MKKGERRVICLLHEFVRRTVKLTEGCTLWMGSKDSGGYGTMKFDGKSHRVHRLFYEYFTNSKIPSNMQIDHKCKNRDCVKISHLRIVTPKQNKINTSHINGRIGHCKYGHPYESDNLYLHNGKRHCRICRAKNKRLSRLSS